MIINLLMNPYIIRKKTPFLDIGTYIGIEERINYIYKLKEYRKVYVRPNNIVIKNFCGDWSRNLDNVQNELNVSLKLFSKNL